MDTVIKNYLEQMKVGRKQSYKNLALYPLLSTYNLGLEYLLLDEALSENLIEIVEKDDGGSVPELRVMNKSNKMILILDGEELVGAKQNRVLNLSIMVPAGETIVIPVSCVEAGRWSYSSGEFQSGSKAQYASARASKSRSVSNNMSMFQEARSDQEEVWAELSSKSARMEASSETSAMSEIYETRQTELKQFAEHLKPVENQVGVIFLINGSVAGLDLFDKSETLAKLMPKLVESYALDAIDPRARAATGGSTDAQKAVEAFLEDVKKASAEKSPSVGLGEDCRLSNGSVTGGGLVVDGLLIHLGVFPGTGETEDESRGRSASLVRASRRRRMH